MDVSLVEKSVNPKVEVTTRYRHLCRTFVQISSEAAESKEGYELAAKGANDIIAKLKNIKKRNESPEKLVPSNNIQNESSEMIFIDNTNVTKVTGLKRKELTRRSNTRPKSFTEKSKKKSRTALPIAVSVPNLPAVTASMCSSPMSTFIRYIKRYEGETEENSWCPIQLSQGSSDGSLTQLLRDISLHGFK